MKDTTTNKPTAPCRITTPQLAQNFGCPTPGWAAPYASG
jgi:hypothetical protein